jgi:hypothetical protein
MCIVIFIIVGFLIFVPPVGVLLLLMLVIAACAKFLFK